MKEHFALPVMTYSIREVAPIFCFHWNAADAGDLNSETWYGDRLETGNRELLDKVVEYNLDDV